MASKGSKKQNSPKFKDNDFVQVIDTESLEQFMNNEAGKKPHPLANLYS